MKMDIFIVSYARDFRYLKYCLSSINKFCIGFGCVHLVIPKSDVVQLYHETGFDAFRRGDWMLHPFDEWPGKGMLHHLFLEMVADQFCWNADLILHTDSDCVFTGPVTPSHYMVGDRPILRYASYKWLASQQPNLLEWQRCVANALGWTPENEFMRCHPAVHYPHTYSKAREVIECHTRQPLDSYIRNGRNEFPQSFAEYPTLGEVAWKFFHPLYHWINEETTPRSDTKIRQAWSHADPTPEDMRVFASLGIA